MSNSFRPVQEVWGEGTACFLNSSDVIQVFETVADRVSTSCEEISYGEMTAFWVENGQSFLTYIEKNPGFNPESIGIEIDYDENAEVEKGLDDGNQDAGRLDLAYLIKNMRALAPAWRKSIDEYGGLRFYVDV